MSRNAERQFSPLQEQVFSLVDTHVGYLESLELLNENAFPAIRLYAYNFFTQHQSPTDQHIQSFRNTCLTISNNEEDYAALSNPLCTIGLQLEAFYPPAARDILRRLEIPLVQEQDPTNRWWEVMLPWTYSAQTQIFMLEQLVRMHALDPIPGLGEGLKGQQRRRMALHTNYGMHAEIHDDDFARFESPDNYQTLIDVNDALTLAFTTGKRIREYDGPSFTSDKQAGRSIKTSEEYMAFRVELRVLEFSEPLAYALLYDSQRLLSGLFAYIWSKKALPAEISLLERKLAQIFQRFQAAFIDIRAAYNLQPNFSNASPDQKEHAAHAIESSGVGAEVRELITQATREIDALLTAV